MSPVVVAIFGANGDAALSERRLCVTAAKAPRPPFDRISLTFSCIAAAQGVLLLVVGEKKAQVWEVSESDDSLPVSILRSEVPRLEVLVADVPY